jgi:positive regulator of sigma E activity
MPCLSAEAVVTRAATLDRVELELQAPTDCGTCRGACMWRGAEPRTVLVHAPSPLQVGARVRVSLPASYLLRAALLVHGLPWAALLVGALIGAGVAQSDWGCLVGLLAGLLFSVMAVPRMQHKLALGLATHLDIRPL